MTLDEIKQKIINKCGPEISPGLDDLVHETASVFASNVNNAGLDSQIEYLLQEGIPAESIISAALER